MKVATQGNTAKGVFSTVKTALFHKRMHVYGHEIEKKNAQMMNWKGSKDYFSTVVNIGMSLMLGVNVVTSAVGMKGNICELVQIIQV